MLHSLRESLDDNWICVTSFNIVYDIRAIILYITNSILLCKIDVYLRYFCYNDTYNYISNFLTVYNIENNNNNIEDNNYIENNVINVHMCF